MINLEDEKFLLDTLKSIDLKHKPYMDNMFILFPSSYSDSESNVVIKKQTLDAWFNRINTLSYQITHSLIKSINHCKKIKNYDILSIYKSKEEAGFEYFFENAVYRLITLWDMLAQVCNIYFETNLSSDLIAYKLYFESRNRNKKVINASDQKKEEFIKFRKKVKKYIKQEENHDYISNKIRNPLIHNHNPYSFSIIDNMLNTRNIPLCDLIRVIEDYKRVSDYINEVKRLIEDEFRKLDDISEGM